MLITDKTVEMKDLKFEDLPEAIEVLLKKVEGIEKFLLDKYILEEEGREEAEKTEFMTVQETANFLNLAVPTIYSKVSQGELPCMKRGKRLYFSRKQIKDYLYNGSTNDK
jgi:excisionase family DNA binding protein